MKKLLIALLLLLIPSVAWSAAAPCSTAGGGAGICYVDTASSGGDGTTTATSGANAAFATIATVNGYTYAAGDQILFKKGCTWREQLTVPSSGSSGNPITFGAYGSGENPIITGQDDITASVWTQQGWVTAWQGTRGNGLNDGATRNYRNVINATTLSSGTKVRVTFAANATSGGGCKIDGASIGLMTTADDFDGAPTRITFGALNTTTIAQGETALSDEITFTFDKTKRYGIHIYTTDRDFAYTHSPPPTTTPHIYYNSGAADDTLTQTVAYTDLGDYEIGVLKVEVYDVTSAIWSSNVLVADPNGVWFDGISYIEASSAGGVNSTNRWFWSAGDMLLYIYATSSPNGFYALIEAPVRVVAVAVYNKSYLTFDGLTIYGGTADAVLMNWGGSAGNSSQYNTIQNCTLDRAGLIATLNMSNGANYNMVQYNTIGGNNIASKSDSVCIGAPTESADGTADNNTIQYNTIFNGTHDNIKLWDTHNTLIQHNEVYNTTGYGRQFGMTQNSGYTGNILRYNYFHDAYLRVDLGDEAWNVLAGDSTQVYYNIFKNTAMVLEDWVSEGTVTKNCLIYNNVFIGEGSDLIETPNKAAIYVSMINASNNGNLFKNNIFYTTTAGTYRVYYYAAHRGPDTDAATFSNNIYYDSTGTSTIYDTGAARTVAYMVANYATYWPSPNLSADPLFINAAGGDFHLAAGSPCKDSGTPVGLSLDYEGKTVYGNPDIGAYDHWAFIGTVGAGPNTFTIGGGSWDVGIQ